MQHEWMTKKFLSEFEETLAKDGFVSNEHLFTPYRDTIVNNVNDIENALNNSNSKTRKLKTGETKSINGSIFYIFEDAEHSSQKMKEKVTTWVNNQYQDE